MKRRVYYKALLKIGDWEYPRYEWYSDLIDPNDEEEKRMTVQMDHMKNRIVGAYRWTAPFNIEWQLGDMEYLTYEI